MQRADRHIVVAREQRIEGMRAFDQLFDCSLARGFFEIPVQHLAMQAPNGTSLAKCRRAFVSVDVPGRARDMDDALAPECFEMVGHRLSSRRIVEMDRGP
jgi:hypothetical protein